MRDKDLFKYLGCFVAIVVGYMLAWTAVTLDYTRFRSLAGVSTPTTGVTTLAASQHPALDDILVKGRIEMIPLKSTPSPPSSNSLTLTKFNTTTGCASCGPYNNSTPSNFTLIKYGRDKEMTVDSVKEGPKEQYHNKGKKKASAETSPPEIQYQYFRVCRAMSWDIVVQLGQCQVL